jgi:tRNA G18 (ribose-2'-O)-methylase SpoU
MSKFELNKVTKDIKWNVRKEFSDLSAKEIKSIYLENADDNKIIIFNLQCYSNTAMMIRQAYMMGVGEVLVLGRRGFNKRPTIGAHNIIKMERVKATLGNNNEIFDNDEIIKILTRLSETHQLIFCEHGGIPLIDIHDHITDKINNSRPVAFIVGTEYEGVPEMILEYFIGKKVYNEADSGSNNVFSTVNILDSDKRVKDSIIVTIPQRSTGCSYNVAMSLSMVLWEYYRLKM